MSPGTLHFIKQIAAARGVSGDRRHQRTLALAGHTIKRTPSRVATLARRLSLSKLHLSGIVTKDHEKFRALAGYFEPAGRPHAKLAILQKR